MIPALTLLYQKWAGKPRASGDDPPVMGAGTVSLT